MFSICDYSVKKVLKSNNVFVGKFKNFIINLIYFKIYNAMQFSICTNMISQMKLNIFLPHITQPHVYFSYSVITLQQIKICFIDCYKLLVKLII